MPFSLFTRRYDFANDRDALRHFLPWLIAFMVYLAVLALAGVLALNETAGRWNRGVAGTLTVQILAGPDAIQGNDEARVKAALGILRATPGIVRAEAIADSATAALLEPWLGGAGAIADLPLPKLIDVEMASEGSVDLQALSRRLTAAVPGASIDDHRIWLERLLRLIGTVKAIALAVLALIGIATVGTVIFTTRTGLAIHREAIEVLHLIGAQDTYIARQFAHRALMLGLKGGYAGLVLALPTLLMAGIFAHYLGASVLPQLSLGPAHWMALAILPIGVALIAMATAGVTVMRTLARLL
ncbi:MAG: cell division protein [Rhodospirillales bacterium]|nr:cell division protein [Rhodospirillales bacterium]